jgi:hypothetical protein
MCLGLGGGKHKAVESEQQKSVGGFLRTKLEWKGCVLLNDKTLELEADPKERKSTGKRFSLFEKGSC